MSGGGAGLILARRRGGPVWERLRWGTTSSHAEGDYVMVTVSTDEVADPRSLTSSRYAPASARPASAWISTARCDPQRGSGHAWLLPSAPRLAARADQASHARRDRGGHGSPGRGRALGASGAGRPRARHCGTAP